MASAKKTETPKTHAAPAATPRVGIHIGISEKDRSAISEGGARLLAGHIAPGSCAKFRLGRPGAARAASTT